MVSPENINRGRDWRDELPRVDSVIHPSLVKYLRQSAVNEYGHLKPQTVEDFANAFLIDFAGNRRIEEMIARIVVRSAIDGIWASEVEINLYSDQSKEGLADYHAQLIAENYGLLKSIRPDERSIDHDPVKALRPTKSLLNGLVSRLNLE